MSVIYIQATLTRTAVNYGDHARDMHIALPVTEDTTLGELVRAGLVTEMHWPARQPQVELEFEECNYITIRASRAYRPVKEDA